MINILPPGARTEGEHTACKAPLIDGISEMLPEKYTESNKRVCLFFRVERRVFEGADEEEEEEEEEEPSARLINNSLS